VARQSAKIFLGVAASIFLCAGWVAAEGRVYPNPEAVEPLAPGERIPVARVETVRGEAVELADRMRESGALLVFYRGGW
jgi:hypothetical protein